MNAIDCIFNLIAWACLWLCAMYLISTVLSMKSYKKPKPQQTDVKCPKNGKLLSDFEVFNGRCITCSRRTLSEQQDCLLDVIKQQRENPQAK